jgi:hypothetical protein
VRWRVTLFRVVGSKRLLRSILRQAGVDEAMRIHFWLRPPWIDFMIVALVLPAFFLEIDWPALIAVTLCVVVVWSQVCNRTLLAIGVSQVAVVESSGVTLLSPAAVLLTSRDTSGRSKRFDAAIRDGESQWSGRFASDKVLTTLEAEWQRLGLPSKSVRALPRRG